MLPRSLTRLLPWWLCHIISVAQPRPDWVKRQMAWGVISELELLLPASLPHQLSSRYILIRLHFAFFLGLLSFMTFMLRCMLLSLPLMPCTSSF